MPELIAEVSLSLWGGRPACHVRRTASAQQPRRAMLAGKTAHSVCRWLSTTGETGAWGAAVSATRPCTQRACARGCCCVAQ